MAAACGNDGAASSRSQPTSTYWFTVGEVVQIPGEPAKVASDGVLLSDPPSGGVIPLENWNWAEVEHRTFEGGVRLSAAPLKIVGGWDGTTLEVISVSTAPSDWSASFPIQRSEACRTDDVLRPFYEINHEALGIRYWSEIESSNNCVIVTNVIWLSPEIEAATAEFGSLVEYRPFVRPVD